MLLPPLESGPDRQAEGMRVAADRYTHLGGDGGGYVVIKYRFEVVR